MGNGHLPVLVREVVELLSGRELVIDATVGGGGHAEALLDSGVRAVVGIDRDPAALEEATGRLRRFGRRFRPVLARFSRIAEDPGVQQPGERVGGVLYDLGLSSMQIDDPERGFGYRAGGPLDMRMGGDREAGTLTAEAVVNTYAEGELARIIFEYGEERFSRRIARAIVRARERSPIGTAEELAGVVAAAVPRRKGRGHPARRTFQAIRIEVNEELRELAASLPRAAGLLEPGGRLVIISYHSLEDRIAKRFMMEQPSLSAMFRRPLRPASDEMAANPRARSARLRSAERMGGHEEGAA